MAKSKQLSELRDISIMAVTALNVNVWVKFNADLEYHPPKKKKKKKKKESSLLTILLDYPHYLPSLELRILGLVSVAFGITE